MRHNTLGVKIPGINNDPIRSTRSVETCKRIHLKRGCSSQHPLFNKTNTHHYYETLNEGETETHMLGELLSGIAQGLEILAKNSYTEKEKETLEEARKILRLHYQEDAVAALDKVIADFPKGVTRRPETETTTRSNGNRSYSAAEFGYDLKNKIKKHYGSLDTVVTTRDEKVVVEVRFLRTLKAEFIIVDGYYQGRNNSTNCSLFEDELKKAEDDIVKACRDIRNS